jgi:hypothetical protein
MIAPFKHELPVCGFLLHLTSLKMLWRGGQNIALTRCASCWCRFKKKFADLGDLGEVGAAASIAGKAIDEDEGKKKAAKGAAKGKGKK